jgi:hypothetical protein
MNRAVLLLVHSMSQVGATMYPDEIELLSTIPKSEDMSPTKLIGGYISHDNCAMANKTGNLLMDLILALGKEAGMSDADLILFQGHCFNHLRNTWFEAIENYLSRKLTEYLKHDLELITAIWQRGNFCSRRMQLAVILLTHVLDGASQLCVLKSWYICYV